MKNSILARYEQAHSLMQGVMTNRIVTNDAVFPHWIDEGRHFWYKRETRKGAEFRLVDTELRKNSSAFDHEVLAALLNQIVGEVVTYQNLPIRNVVITLSPLQVSFSAFDKQWLFDPELERCEEIDETTKAEGLNSPDGKNIVYVFDYNVWVRNKATGKKQALTKDGLIDYYYAAAPTLEAFTASSGPSPFINTNIQALWSPDSSRLFTCQLDRRNVASRPLVHHVPKDGSLQPQLSQVKFAYPGDKYVETYRLVAIDVLTGHVQPADYGPIPFWGVGLGFFTDEHLGWWSLDSRHAYFVDVARGAKTVRVVEFDTYTGSTRILFEETSNEFVKLSHCMGEKPIFLPIPENDELIWFSERTGWGHLYLYDLTTGKLKHPITEGEWQIRGILHYDPKRRELIVQTAGHDTECNPYYRDICKVSIDSGNLTTLASGCFEHQVYQTDSFQVRVRDMLGVDCNSVSGVSPDGSYIVTTRSRVNTAPVSVLIDREGVECLNIETADVSRLPSDWYWPEPIKLKGADNKTDIYGVIYRPPGFSEKERYPVLDFSCGMRNLTFVPQGSFINGPCLDLPYMMGAALAALGFIVVAMEGRGTPNRNKEFQNHKYGDVASTCDFEDRIAVIRELAKRYPYMDLDRVGITGSDNLASPVYGMLNHPDFYKVAVVHCFHDPRFSYPAPSEQYHGISTDNTALANTLNAEDRVEALKGKLLLIQGMLDFATPSGTFRLVDALQKANKDFDMICLPNAGHDIPTYALRRNWDYLVKNLQHIEPPKEFDLVTGPDLLMKGN